MIIPVILSGGSGTRLWPLSTPERPKQFLPLTGTETLFEQTLGRCSDSNRYASPIVVANARQQKLCEEQGKAVEGSRLILEPIARNTAVAIVMAAKVAADRNPDALILVMPSDHYFGDEAAFHAAVERGRPAAERGYLVTFGINPTGPETGYGYLAAGEPLADLDGVSRVARFTEKPDLPKAQAMLADGQHFWNGGIFLFQAATLLEEAAKVAPEVTTCGIEALADVDLSQPTIRPDLRVLERCPDISIDYALMERSERVAMVSLDAQWSDVGSWDALAELAGERNNPASSSLLDTSNCFIRSDGLKISLLGVEDLIVVAAGDQVVIMRKGSSQRIKQLAALTPNS